MGIMSENLSNGLMRSVSLDMVGALLKGGKSKNSAPLVRFTDTDHIVRRWYQTENPLYNYIFGNGFPTGCAIEFFGGESTGKTTTVNTIIGELQRRYGAIVIYFDTELSLDEACIFRTRLDTGSLLMVDADACNTISNVFDTLSEKLEILAPFVTKEDCPPVIIMWDSLGGTATKSLEQAKEKGTTHMRVGEVASEVQEGLKNNIYKLRNMNATMVICNQLRSKISTGYGANYGPTTDVAGGKALKHFNSIRIEVENRNPFSTFNPRKTKIMYKDEQVGIITQLTTVKNKLAPPARTIGLVNMAATGIDAELSCLVYASEHIDGFPTISGGRIKIGEKNLFVNQAADLFRRDANLRAELFDTIQNYFDNKRKLELGEFAELSEKHTKKIARMEEVLEATEVQESPEELARYEELTESMNANVKENTNMEDKK